MPSEPAPTLEQFLSDFAEISDLREGWARLCKALAGFEIDRAFYARKPQADLQNFHNRFRLTYFSSYGDAADQLLVGRGGYVVNRSIRWAVENAGAISWGVNHERYLAGEMSAQEEALHLGLRELGLIAGITYSNPILPNHVRSGFGLCFRAGLDQHDVDRIWADRRDQITACLQVFELAASQCINVAPGKELTARQIEILRLVIDGKTVNEVAVLLNVHRRTIDSHLAAAREKLGVATTLQAAVMATQQGQL